MKQQSSKAVTLSPAAVAWLLGRRPVTGQQVRVGTSGPHIRLVRS
ncbi:hypothetical protein [Luteococcus peritonei]|uniref:Uncharacterized protein n=1 Tax=Luteococcus peritonei TaxID=88874 RepID=A0ABW4RUU6_9ACTN